MNVENLTEAYYINNGIKELQRQKGILESGDGLGVTIQSTYQDKAFLDAIRPHAVAELNRRIEEKKAVLVSFGISFT
ncbi:hypothetical protein AAB26_10880 [Salmonella enterica subsp. houtenae]|uniref:Uncharacterized protein n=1 Tax=Salmonella enterica subsp. houtenae serovar 48:z4,z32:- TaxID=2577535 RepID=A0A729J5Y3_SALHO|nr:hypothetical protein [Citrobacter sp. Cb022]EBQ8223282.1 hypothetical protein [Salmonella enterica]ECH9932345.1 hypothetical protein [Salmonella enterica subsp. houtenae]EEA9136245.1 hypothetical protein [Salmonella enterica subsp. enterica]EKR1447086.1 hypothetical protein [Salmonella enterica subsp. houtenae serovar 48:z4,z32:-]ECZ5452042.1 hypothetical protein [Salmonella enterica subsp. houtenae]